MDRKGEHRFCEKGRIQGWFVRPQEKCLLAVSGGSDSMAMLKLFLDFYDRDKIAVAHLDHGIRDSSVRDREFVQSVCSAFNVPCSVERRPVPELRKKGESLEEAARRIRYEFLEEMRARYGARWVALGHTRNDLAENVMMNLARGCGIWGLAGMPEMRDPFIRPVLDFTRMELREILEKARWRWVDDETNDSDAYLRNRVRLEVLPLIEKRLNSRIVDHLADLAAEVSLWRTEEETAAQEDLETLRISGSWPWLLLDLPGLRTLRSFYLRRTLRSCARQAGIGMLDRRRWYQLENLIRRSGRWIFQWGSFTDAVARDGMLILGPAAEKLSAEAIVLPGRPVRWGGWEVCLRPVSEGQSVPWSLWGPAVSEVRLLRRSVVKGDWLSDRLPRVCWGENFFADPKITGWENSGDSVKCESVLRLDFRPLSGQWRFDDGL